MLLAAMVAMVLAAAAPALAQNVNTGDVAGDDVDEVLWVSEREGGEIEQRVALGPL